MDIRKNSYKSEVYHYGTTCAEHCSPATFTLEINGVLIPLCQTCLDELNEKLTSEILREREEESAKDTEVPEVPPRLDVCPKCGADAAVFVHPTFDGGSYVKCKKCMYSDQAKTWAPTDAQAAVRWNKMERN